MVKRTIEEKLSREVIEEDLSTLEGDESVLNKEKSEESLDEKARELQLLLQIIEEISKEGGKEMLVENKKEDEELLELADRLGNEIAKSSPYRLAGLMSLKEIGEAKEKLNRLLEKIRLFREMDSKKDNTEANEDSKVVLDKVELASKYRNDTKKPAGKFKSFVMGTLVTLFGASPIIGNIDKSFGADVGDPSVQANDPEHIKKLKEIEDLRRAAEESEQSQNTESDTLPGLEINKSLRKEIPDWCKNYLTIKAMEDGNFEIKFGPITYKLSEVALKEAEDYKKELDSNRPIGAKTLLRTGYEKRTKELVEAKLKYLRIRDYGSKELTDHQRMLRDLRAKEKSGRKLSVVQQRFLEDNKDEELDKSAGASQKAEKVDSIIDNSSEVRAEDELNPMIPEILNDIQEIREIRDEINKIRGTQEVIKPYNDERLDEFERQVNDNVHNPDQLSILKNKIKNGLSSIKGTKEGLEGVEDTRPGGSVGGMGGGF